MSLCELIESEFFPCGEPAPYSAQRDGERVRLCANHAALAVLDGELVLGVSGHPARYDHIDGELFEVSQ